VVIETGTILRGTWKKSRRFVMPIVLVILWQAVCSAGLVSPRMVPSPIAVTKTAGELLASGELLHSIGISLARVLIGLSVGIVIGVVLALVAGLSRAGEDSVDATIQMLRTLPFLGLVPLFILWFGIGETPKIALVIVGTVFPIYMALFSGIRDIDKKLVEAAVTLGLSRWELVTHIILPGSVPAALIGLRYGMGIALLTLVVAEQINADSGIGFLIMNARDIFRTDIIFLGLIIYAILGLAADQLARAIERKMLYWRPTFVKA
jgi:sulfonate transport system permease protein